MNLYVSLVCSFYSTVIIQRQKAYNLKMMKGKKYDFKDSNLALFGSDIERKVKEAAAETEEAWQGSGEDVGVEIWRIVKFQVVPWPKDQYGKSSVQLVETE